VSDQPNAPDPNTPADGTPTDPVSGAQPGTPPPATTTSAAAPPPTSTSWPNSAKATTAVLAVLTIGAVILAIVGFSQASNESDDRTDAESGMAEAIERAESAETERDELAGQLEESEATVESLTDERDEAVATSEQLSTELATETERADAAEAQLQEISESYPITIDSNLDPETVAGTYQLDLTETFCFANAPCGSLPSASQATISADGSNLVLTIDGLLTNAGLANYGGTLFAVADSTTAYAPCPAGERTAQVSVTMWAGDTEVAEDGTRTIVDLGGSISIAAAAISDDCLYGHTLYVATFTPVS
jgi:hypothetical protein